MPTSAAPHVLPGTLALPLLNDGMLVTAEALLLHVSHDRVVDDLGFSGRHEATAPDRVADRLAAARADGGQQGEPVQESRPVAGYHFLAGKEAEGVLPVDRRDEVGQHMVQHLAARHDLRLGGTDLNPGDNAPRGSRDRRSLLWT